MTKAEAIAKAERDGFTIMFQSSETEVLLRNPTDAMNASGYPTTYAKVFRGPNGKTWGYTKAFDKLGDII